MSAFPESSGLEVFPQLQNEWRWEEGHLRHLHSPDLSVVVRLAGAPMREVDLLSSREAYSFPFCPRVYRFAIGGNHLSDIQLSFDLQILLEHVPSRVSSHSGREVYSRLAGKLLDLLRCFEYLRQRFGPFRIRKEMIGWTELGVVKAWLHSDFSLSHPEQPAGSEQEMLSDFFVVLKESGLLDHLRGKQFSTFRMLREHVQQHKQVSPPLSSHQTPRPSDNRDQNVCQSQSGEPERFQPIQARSSNRKNITFSYSNKDLNINDKLALRENSSKQNSITALEDFKYENQSKVLTLKKEFTFGHCVPPAHDQTCSMKVIYPQARRTNKKYSFFHHPTAIEAAGQLRVQKMADLFKIKTAERQEPFRANLLRLTGKEKPQLLHYSTSTNPYSKFINKKGTEDKSVSSFDRHEDSFEGNGGKENKKGRCGGIINELFDSTEEKEEKRGCQELTQDLDALFDSRHDYDENELEDELENILL